MLRRVLILALALFAMPAMALDLDPYAGVSVGIGAHNPHTINVLYGDHGGRGALTYGAFAGLDVLPNAAVEMDVTGVNIIGSADGWIAGVSAIGYKPITPTGDAYLRAGMHKYDLGDEYDYYGISGYGPSFGIGWREASGWGAEYRASSLGREWLHGLRLRYSFH